MCEDHDDDENVSDTWEFFWGFSEGEIFYSSSDDDSTRTFFRYFFLVTGLNGIEQGPPKIDTGSQGS